VRIFLWWFGHSLVIFLCVICIVLGLRVLSMASKDSVNSILSLTLLVVGVLLLVHFVASIGKRIRHGE
jgi:hypothetical protein